MAQIIQRIFLGACAFTLLCVGARAQAASGLGGGTGGPTGPTRTTTPLPTPTPGMSGSVVASAGGSGALNLPGGNDYDPDAFLKHRAELEPWTTWFEVSAPQLMSVGAARELPLGFRAGGAIGVVLLMPSFRAELQLPPVHAGPVRLYAAGSAAWMYVSRTRQDKAGASRAWGAGPKIGFEYRLPLGMRAAHGWHVGADAGYLVGDFSDMFGTKYKKGLPVATPIRVGYYW